MLRCSQVGQYQAEMASDSYQVGMCVGGGRKGGNVVVWLLGSCAR